MASTLQPTEAARELWATLWNKQQLLYDFLQNLNDRLLPDDRPNHAGVMMNAKYEIERIDPILEALLSGGPMPFPGEDQVRALRASVGRLHQAVTAGARVSELIEAATVVIATWPLSDGG